MTQRTPSTRTRAVWLAPRAYWALAIVAALFAAGGAFAPFLWLAIAVAGLLFIALAADAAMGPARSAIVIARTQPQNFALRHQAALEYTVTNRSSAPVTAGIVESGCDKLRYRAEAALVHAPSRATVAADLPVMPVARGEAQLDALYCWYENALGLLRRYVRVPCEQRVRIYPDLSAVERYGTLRARNRIIEAGLRRMRLRGIGTQPESVRDWMAGDSFRAMNWKATARRGRLTVTEYEVERSQNVLVMLDAGRLMTAHAGDQRKFDYALTAALSVAAVAALANDKVGAVAFAGEILRAFAPRPGGRSAHHAAAELFDLEPRFEEADYDRAFTYVRTHVRKRSLVLLFTDMIDPVAQSAVLAQIRTLAHRHLVVCVFMNDRAIEDALEQPMNRTQEVYSAAVALELQDERSNAAAVLERLGVSVIDVPARDLTTALIDTYLGIKQRGLL